MCRSLSRQGFRRPLWVRNLRRLFAPRATVGRAQAEEATTTARRRLPISTPRGKGYRAPCRRRPPPALPQARQKPLIPIGREARGGPSLTGTRLILAARKSPFLPNRRPRPDRRQSPLRLLFGRLNLRALAAPNTPRSPQSRNCLICSPGHWKARRPAGRARCGVTTTRFGMPSPRLARRFPRFEIPA